MLSRVADAIYWMNRYVERAENVARFVDVNLRLGLDLPEGGVEDWEPLVATTGDDVEFRARHAEATQANVMHFLTFDETYPSSILSCLRAARENARSIREVISSEMWESINSAYLFVADAATRAAEILESPYDFYARIKLASHEHIGVTYVTMTHNEAWHFARLGRLLERADKTSRIVDVKYFVLLPEPGAVGTPYDEIQWTALLKSASAFEMYRKMYGRIVPATVVEFLLLDPKFPRSVRYSITKAERSLHAITGTPREEARNSPEKHLGRLRSELDYADASEIIAGGLHEYLDAVQTKINRVGDAVFDTFFALHPVQRVDPGANQ